MSTRQAESDGDALPARVEAGIAVIRDFMSSSPASRVAAVVDLGDGHGAVVDCVRGEPIEVVWGNVTARVGYDARGRREEEALASVERTVAVEVDAGNAVLSAPLGALERLASEARGLSGALGGASAVTVQFETSDPQAPLAIAARAGEPLILALGDEQFPMPPGWPAAAGAQ
jgi:hypothetical protein